MTWNERDHPRDRDGRWARKLSGRIGSQIQTASQQREDFMQRALQVRDLFGWRGTPIQIRDGRGEVVAAVGLVDRTDEDPPSVVIDSLGGRGGGAGTRALRRSIDYAMSVGAEAIHVEPTAESLSFWRDRMGFVEDPLQVGAFYYGLDRDGMAAWLRRYGSPTAEDYR